VASVYSAAAAHRIFASSTAVTDKEWPLTTREDLHSILHVVKTVFQRYDIWYCLFYGTLLGAVREADLIEWDHDIDLLIRPSDVPRLLELSAELEVEDIRFQRLYPPGTWLALNPGRIPWIDIGWLKVIVGERHRVDLWAPTLFSDGILRHYDLETEVVLWSEAAFPAYFVEQLDTAMIRNEPYPVPVHADRLLSLLYGPNWRVPFKCLYDGGEHRDGLTKHGGMAEPNLRDHVLWCEAQGWDRTRYRGQPVWPRTLRGAGGHERSTRTRDTSRSAWWHTLDEIVTYSRADHSSIQSCQ
jgi:hypothetical protein